MSIPIGQKLLDLWKYLRIGDLERRPGRRKASHGGANEKEKQMTMVPNYEMRTQILRAARRRR
jgi:hypothetical protein